MCVVENSGRFGGTFAAPMVGLMIEKYLTDSLDKNRMAQAERLSNTNLIPSRINQELRRQDSLRHSKDSAYLISKGYLKIIKDTLGLEDSEDDDLLQKQSKQKTNTPGVPTRENPVLLNSPAILPNKQKNIKDSLPVPQ